MKKTFYELYLEKKNETKQPSIKYQDKKKAQSQNKIWSILIQLIELIFIIFALTMATFGILALINPHIRNEMLLIWTYYWG